MAYLISASTTCVTWSIAYFSGVMRSNNPLGMISSHFSPVWSMPAERGADQLQCGMELWDALLGPPSPQLSSCWCSGLFFTPCLHCSVAVLRLAQVLLVPALARKATAPAPALPLSWLPWPLEAALTQGCVETSHISHIIPYTHNFLESCSTLF